MTDSENPNNQIECLYPILVVSSLKESLAWYSEVIGFKQDWSTGSLAQVSREGFGIMLDQGPPVHPQEVWIGVELLEPLYEEFKTNGATIAQEPQNHSWAFDMKIKDPDGHILWLGAGPKEDQPYED